MAIQVDKFDFDSMPVMDHDATATGYSTPAGRERQQVQGGLINSTLDITGPSYPLLKPAVLITLSLTLSSWHYSETENTRVIWVAHLIKAVF